MAQKELLSGPVRIDLDVGTVGAMSLYSLFAVFHHSSPSTLLTVVVSFRFSSTQYVDKAISHRCDSSGISRLVRKGGNVAVGPIGVAFLW